MESFYAETSSTTLGICTLVGWYIIQCWCGIICEGIMGQGEEYTLVDHVVNSSFTPQDWLMNFRVSKATFKYLCIEVNSVFSYQASMWFYC